MNPLSGRYDTRFEGPAGPDRRMLGTAIGRDPLGMLCGVTKLFFDDILWGGGVNDTYFSNILLL